MELEISEALNTRFKSLIEQALNPELSDFRDIAALCTVVLCSVIMLLVINLPSESIKIKLRTLQMKIALMPASDEIQVETM